MAENLSTLKIELDRLRAERNRIVASLLSPSTVMGYRYDWKMFQTWCSSVLLESLPACSETVSLYLTYLLSEGKKVTTARRRCCSIAYYHRVGGFKSPIDESVNALLLGAQRSRGEKPRQMRPLTMAHIREISIALGKEGSDRSGAGELLIASQTGHRSMQMLRRYFRRSELFRTNACTGLGF